MISRIIEVEVGVTLKPGSHLCDKHNTSISTRKKKHVPFFLCLCLCLCHLCYAYCTSVNQALSRLYRLFWISQKRNLIIVFSTLNEKKTESQVFASSLTATKHVNLTWLPLEIMHCGHTWCDYLWPWVSLTWLLYNLQLWHQGRWFRKFTVHFQPIRKEIASTMYNNIHYCRELHYFFPR